MYGNQRNWATVATAGGNKASGATRPARNIATPACSSMIAVARVVQKASSPVVKLMKNRIAAANETATATRTQRPGSRGSRTAGQTLAAMSQTTRIVPELRAL